MDVNDSVQVYENQETGDAASIVEDFFRTDRRSLAEANCVPYGRFESPGLSLTISDCVYDHPTFDDVFIYFAAVTLRVLRVRFIGCGKIVSAYDNSGDVIFEEVVVQNGFGTGCLHVCRTEDLTGEVRLTKCRFEDSNYDSQGVLAFRVSSWRIGRYPSLKIEVKDCIFARIATRIGPAAIGVEEANIWIENTEFRLCSSQVRGDFMALSSGNWMGFRIAIIGCTFDNEDMVSNGSSAISIDRIVRASTGLLITNFLNFMEWRRVSAARSAWSAEYGGRN
jgi:hypothetical protein